MVHNADNEGNFQFNNIFQGEVTIRAQVPALGGLGGKKTVAIDFEGQEAFSVITLEAVGEVAGRVVNPETGEAVPGARAVLYASGFFDSITTDDQGQFRFHLLPLGFYQVKVFDPTTGRRGDSQWVEVEYNHHVALADVTLEVRGEVEGHFYDGSGGTPIPGTPVQLWSRGLSWFRTYSSTDENGYYEFLGIPEGEFSLSAVGPSRLRRAQAEGEILAEDERITVDLELAAFGRVVGQVLNPPGMPPGLFDNVNVRLVQRHPFGNFDMVLGATTDNPFEVDGVIPGRSLTIFADEIGGLHSARYSGRLSEDGGTLEVDMPMVAIGAVTVSVRDSLGEPVTGADVAMTTGSGSYAGSTGVDHLIHFDDVRAGTVNTRAQHPFNGLKGSSSDQLELEGQNLEVDVTLQSSGVVRGRVVLADGSTPAVGATVALAKSGKFYLDEAGENGEFEFESIALGSYTLTVQELDGPGTIRRQGSLSANAEIDDFGTLVLDDVDPFVVSITPPSQSRDLPLATTLVVEFSEALDRGALPGGWLQVRRVGGGALTSTLVWSNGDQTVTVTPQGLASGTGYELRITTGTVDLAGRHMSWLVRSTFNTADVIPPNVIDILPRDGQNQVPIDSLIVITFSEPIVEASLSGAGLELHDLSAGRQLTTTFQLRLNERQIVLTPQEAIFADRLMQVRVKNAMDKAGNVMVGEVVTTYWTPDETPPTLSWLEPAAGAVFTAGDEVPVAVEASDNRGMERVDYTVGDWTFTSTEPPFSQTLIAPVVEVASDVVITATAVDLFGNQTPVARTIHVEPHVNAEGPVVEAVCWADGDFVAPGFEIPLAYSITDDERIESISFSIDGERRQWLTPVNAATAAGTFHWRPPQTAAPGTVFQLRLEARDFAGNIGIYDAAMTVPGDGRMLLSDQIVNPILYPDERLYLAHGIFTFNGSPQLDSLRLMRGAVVRSNVGAIDFAVAGDVSLQGGSRIEMAGVDVTTDGNLTLQCSTRIDVTSGGYSGGSGGQPGGAPAGVAPAYPDAGGSHGGTGLFDIGSGPAGEVYDSVYRPQLGGAGGAGHNGSSGRAGGGVATFEAQHVVLDGQILALGASINSTSPAGSGAGGTVVLRAASLRGTGSIDVSGAQTQFTPCCGPSGAGGGGRVALLVDDVSGFDAAAQVSARGGGKGVQDDPGYAAPGTVYVRDAAATYGWLIVDAGSHPDGVQRLGAATELPALGEGQITSLTSQGSDAVVGAAAAFKVRWIGAWMTLTDGSGASLGRFEVVELTTSGEVVLAGAGAVVGAVGYRGEYFFDRLRLVSADLQASDPLSSTTVELLGTASLPPHLVAHDLTLGSGARLRASSSSLLEVTVTGTLSIAADASIDMTGYGYAGGSGSGNGPGEAPEWVTRAARDAGGSHGGTGLAVDYPGPAGEVYDSVYAPRLAGGGGAGDNGQPGRAGGGVILITAGDLVLEGAIRAQGVNGFGSSGGNGFSTSAGAGGTVRIDTGSLSGGGSIDVSGGNTDSFPCCGSSGTGGGGRVAIYAGDLSGFDVVAQVKAEAGGAGGTAGDDGSWAVPGTLFVFDDAATYGRLIIDSATRDGQVVRRRRASVQTLGGAETEHPAERPQNPDFPDGMLMMA